MYTYGELQNDINRLRSMGAMVGSIGKSVYGNELFFIYVGKKNVKPLIITGGIHARENVTCRLVVEQAYTLIGKDLPIGVYFLPMLNPDGALLLEKGAHGSYADFVLGVNGSNDFSQWKANGRAVDLNLNFDAKFGQGKGNVFSPAPHGYVGEKPFSEPETSALRDMTLRVAPSFTVSYHALGREVYWYFGQKEGRARAKKIAEFLSYKLVDGDLGSAGGYKDWCIMQGIPAVTIEIGAEGLNHPLSFGDVKEDIERNVELISLLAELKYS